MHKMKDRSCGTDNDYIVQGLVTMSCHFQGVVVALESVRLATLLAAMLDRLLARELALPGDHKQTQNH